MELSCFYITINLHTFWKLVKLPRFPSFFLYLDDEGGVPEVGDSVYVPKLKNEATVVKIDSSKNEVQVQAGMMKLKLKLKDVKVQKRKVSR